MTAPQCAAQPSRPVQHNSFTKPASLQSPRLKQSSLRALNIHTAPGNSSVGNLNEVAAEPRTQQGQTPGTVKVTVGGTVWNIVAGTQALAGQFMSAWSPKATNTASSSSSAPQGSSKLLRDAAVRGNQAEQAASKPAKKPLANLEPFTKAVGVMETRYVRMLSNLCGLSYQMPNLTARSLWRRHKLELVTTSYDTSKVVSEAPRSALQVFNEADAMAASTQQVESVRRELEASQQRTVQALEAMARADALRKPQPSGAELVAAKLYEAAAAAASAAAAAASSAAAPLANNITAFTTNVVPVMTVASTLQSAAAAGHSTAVTTIATVTAAVEATWSRGSTAPEAKDALSPTDWFVADDAATCTRYFVIMGSDNMDHWKTNLTFDPVQFEDAALGARVHRGVYEAAQVLYERFLPLVEEHVRSNPFARLAFTGHSLGGSIATLLVMMYVYRGVLSPVNLAPTYTFGSPAIFCEGCCDCGCCGGGATECSCDVSGGFSSSVGRRNGRASKGLLARVGLKETSIKNVIMHKDIVPRAFACDYSLVADLLRRVGDSFREHSCLSGPARQAMYYFVGKIMVLQPSDEHTFVRKGEGYHPGFPQRPGLFLLREPTVLSSATSVAVHEVSNMAGGTVNPEQRPVPGSLVEAVHNLMDTPHPLDILSETEAYGNDGAISRYHNPDNYTRALGGVLRTKVFWRLFPPAVGAGTGAQAWYMQPQNGDETARKPKPVTYLGVKNTRPIPLFQLQKRKGIEGAKTEEV